MKNIKDIYGYVINIQKKCVKKISPILNRCVIFNTTNNSLHGHPESLNVPDNIKRHSIALYYYTKT